MEKSKDSMSSKRYYLLQKYPQFFSLTDEEKSLGWHYCGEWDYLLVGPGTPEWELCNCFVGVEGVENGKHKKDKGKDSKQKVHTKGDADG